MLRFREITLQHAWRALGIVALLMAGCESDYAPVQPQDAGVVEVSAEELTAVRGCTDRVYQGHVYRYCSAFVPWRTARDRCRSYGLDLVRIESAAENGFVSTLGNFFLPRWIGANDLQQEETWAWSAGDVPFYQGSMFTGFALNGAYENFPSWEPVIDGGALDCANIRPFTGGAWLTTSCLEFSTFVCEDVDQCPGDPTKDEPGDCGCGFADDDRDGDGTADCIDECPDDPAKAEEGVCDCGEPDTDGDGDGVPDCIDEAPGDADQQEIGECGSAAAPAAAGTPCDDGICRGVFACDGQGVCGDPATDCPLTGPGAGSCRSAQFDGRIYTFCTGPSRTSSG